MAKYSVFLKKSAIKQLRAFPTSTQQRIQNGVMRQLIATPHIADGTHIKKLTDGYRLRVGNYRVFYFVEAKNVTITSIVRRTSTTY